MSNTINGYVAEINKYALLSLEEEQECFKLMKKDESIKEKIIKSNLRLVVKIAQDYKNMGVSFEDLVGAGNMGLINAVEKYDLNKGSAKFSSYAGLWIRAYMRKELSATGRVISFCGNTLNKMKKVKEIQKTMGEDFNIDECKNQLKCKDKYAQTIINGYSQVSLNEKVGENENTELLEGFKDENDFINSYEVKDTFEYVQKCMKDLTETEKTVLEYRYGLNGKEFLTAQKVAKIIGLTRQRVDQIERNALMKLKGKIEK